jgi:preprotein translocase subunit SecG
MATVVLTIHLLIAVTLIIVVLLQRSEGGGLGIGGGGGVMTGRGAATALAKTTWALGIAFVATSLFLTVIAARDSSTDSVMETPGAPAATSEEPVEPATAPADLGGGDLLPPLPSEGPAAPPPVQ